MIVRILCGAIALVMAVVFVLGLTMGILGLDIGAAAMVFGSVFLGIVAIAGRDPVDLLRDRIASDDQHEQ